jgi:hypothetical protein
MENDEKKTIAFSLMATLNNTSKNLFYCVYMPLFKYGLSQYSKEFGAGRDLDLQESIVKTVGITIPLLTLHKMLYALNDEISRKEKTKLGFNIMERGKSFQIINFEYREIDEILNNERRKVNALNQAYSAYCSDCESTETFNDFIKFNFIKLSSFFSSRKVIDLDESQLAKYHKQAEFLKYIENSNPELYDIAKNAYIGSFITVLLETGFQLETKGIDSVQYYIDTRLVLSALNLQTEIEYISTNELLELIRKNNGKICVMDRTIEEIEFNINNAIDHFNDNPAIGIINNNTINAAAIRNKLSKTDLQVMVGNIRKNVIEKLSANVNNTPNTVIEKVKKSDELKKLESIRERRPATALHDVIAIHYIRHLRGGFIENHKKVKSWFVTDNDGLYNFDTRLIPINNVPEVVLTEDLAFLLWLKDIDKGNAPFLQTGLNEYISRILVSDLPDYVVLDDLYDNIRKYKEVDPEVANDLLDSMAHASCSEIEALNVVAEKEPDEFALKLTEVKKKRKLEEEQKKDETQDAIFRERSYKERIDRLEQINSEIRGQITRIEQEIIPIEKNKNTILENAVIQMEQRTIKLRKIAIFAVITPVLIISSYFIYIYLSGYLKVIITGITGLGGLWAFINLITNTIRSIHLK